jgi:hypothetical protein
METRIALMLLALFAVAESSTGADGEYSPEVLFEYNATNPAPDYLVFESYLGNVNATDKQHGKSEAVHFIQDTLEIGHNENGNRRASDLYGVFSSRHELMRADIDEAQRRILCNKSGKKKTEDEVYDLIDGTPDIIAGIAEKHYLETLTTIDSETAQSLNIMLQRDKESFASTRFTARSMFEGPDVDVRKHVKNMCRNLAKKG